MVLQKLDHFVNINLFNFIPLLFYSDWSNFSAIIKQIPSTKNKNTTSILKLHIITSQHAMINEMKMDEWRNEWSHHKWILSLSVISNVPWNCRIHACKTTEIYRKILPTEKDTIQTKKNIQQFNIFFSNEICSLSIKIILLIILLYKVFFYVDFVKWQ